MKNKKTVLITGSSRGIGAAAAEIFAEKGYNVVINYKQSEKEAQSLLKKLISKNHSAIAVQAEISNENEAKNLINQTIKTFGKIDVLVNNASISQQKIFTEITSEEWQKIFDVNVTGTFNCTQFAIKDMLKRKEGKILNISSIWGITGASCEVHYSTTKAAIIGFTKALAKELALSNIQVNCIAPGVIDTEMNQFLSLEEKKELIKEIPAGRFGTTQEIAETIAFLCSDSANYITGQILSPNGGFLI